MKDFSYGLKATGFDFSKRGVLSCTIYDKSREMKQSGKEWFCDIWRSHGWREDEDGSVWRVEFKFKRQAVHELHQEGVFLGVEDALALPERLSVLWAYAARHVEGGYDNETDG